MEITLNMLRSYIRSDLQAVIYQNNGSTDPSVQEYILNRPFNYITPPEYVYTNEHYAICDNSEFNIYADDLDFSHCKNYLQCLQHEATMRINNAWSDLVGEVVEQLAEQYLINL